MDASSAASAASKYRLSCTIEMLSRSPTLSNSWARASAGSSEAKSRFVPNKSLIVFSYSCRFKRLSTVPFPALCA